MSVTIRTISVVMRSIATVLVDFLVWLRLVGWSVHGFILRLVNRLVMWLMNRFVVGFMFMRISVMLGSRSLSDCHESKRVANCLHF